MTKRTKILSGAILLAALLLVSSELLVESGDSIRGRSADTSAIFSGPPPAQAAEAAPIKSVDQPSTFTPIAASTLRIDMPPAGLPAVEVIARLESAARSGNVPASCRIALELQDCANRKGQLAAADAVEQGIRSTGASSKQLEDMTGGLLAASDRLEAKCSGITDKQLAGAFEYQMTAARGNPELARWLVANPVLDRSLFIDQLEEWQRYKEFADQYLAAAAKHPSPQNLPLLLAAYKPRSFPNIELIHRDDPAMFLALVDVAQRGGATLPNDVLELARETRSSPGAVEAASRRRSALEDAGWAGAALGASEFMPGPLRKPSIEQCAQVR